MYGLEMLIMITGTIGTAVVGSTSHINMFALIIFWRIVGGNAHALLNIKCHTWAQCLHIEQVLEWVATIL